MRVFEAAAAVDFIFYCLCISVLSALVMFYSAVDSVRSIRVFNLCGLVMLAESVTWTYLFIACHFNLIVLSFVSFLVNSHEATHRRVVVYL